MRDSNLNWNTGGNNKSTAITSTSLSSLKSIPVQSTRNAGRLVPLAPRKNPPQFPQPQHSQMRSGTRCKEPQSLLRLVLSRPIQIQQAIPRFEFAENQIQVLGLIPQYESNPSSVLYQIVAGGKSFLLKIVGCIQCYSNSHSVILQSGPIDMH